MAIQKLAVVATAVVCVVGVSVGIGWRGLVAGPAPNDAPVSPPPEPATSPQEKPAELVEERPSRSEVEDPLAWTKNFLGPTQERFGDGYVEPFCPECGAELPCPDHLTKLPIPNWALEESVPRGVRSAFYHLPKFLKKIRNASDRPEIMNIDYMAPPYAIGISVDKWLNGDVLNAGYYAGAWELENSLPSPLPNMNGESPGDPGWCDFVGTFNGEGVISWHYTEYPEWIIGWEAHVFAEDPTVAVNMSEENWAVMRERVEKWYAWACEQVELAKGN